jgi:hypothetical protein
MRAAVWGSVAYFVLPSASMRDRTRTDSLRFLVVAVATVMWGGQALALHEESPPVVRVTGVDNHVMSPGRAWGNWLSFASTQDLQLLGADREPGKQIFLWNMAYYDCFNGTTKVCAPNVPPGQCQNTPCPPADIQAKYLRQLTNGVGDPDNPSISIPPQLSTCDGTKTGIVCSSGNAAQVCPDQTCEEVPSWFLEDRQWIAFDALGAFNGNVGPAATRRQIFMKNIGTGEIRQVTFSGTGDSVRPSIGERGGIVVFESTASLDGFPNPAGVKQVYIFQRATGSIRLISKGLPPLNTIGLGPSSNPHPTETGSGVTFQSTADLLGNGQDSGVSQIYFAKFDRQNAVVTDLLRVTNGNGPSRNPFIGNAQTPPGQVGESKKIVFESEASNLPGSMQVPGLSIFEIGIDVSNAVLDPAIAQVTPPAIFGDCMAPSIDASGKRIPMICTGDPLLNGTTGNRLFILDRQQNTLYQITGTGDVQGTPQSSLGQWFVAFATTSDLTGAGVCGYQLYIIDYFTGRWAAATQLGQLPPDVIGQSPRSTIGLRTFEFKESGTTPASRIASITSDGEIVGPMVDDGRIGLNIGAPDEFTGEAPIAVQKSRVQFPPTIIPGIGAVCIVPASDGQGLLDCTGNAPGLDVTLAQDHNIDDTDYVCQTGCREDQSCPGMLNGTHQSDCPRCDEGTATCDSGAAAGQVCDPGSDCPNGGVCNDGVCPIICTPGGSCAGGGTCVDPDAVCQVGLDCTSDKEPTCNGRPVTSQAGVYGVGSARVTIPVKVTVSLDPGPDDVFCSGDAGELYSNLRDLDAVMRLTTGTSTATLSDVNNVPAATATATETGTPFNCDALRAGDLAGVTLVGHLSALDASLLPGLRDLLLEFRLEAKPGILGSCSPPCTGDGDCDDLNPCNGVESCISNRCSVGTPTPCDDGDFCNGLETCDPVLGCQAGTLPTCDDSNECTSDSCDPSAGCVLTPVAGPCDDGNLCSSGDTCQAGACVGTQTLCTDNDACNGLEACNPSSGACDPGTGPNCDDGNPCTTDSCDPAVGCVNAPNTDVCDDGNACTENDVCGGGSGPDVCGGTLTAAAQTCNAGNGTVCDGTEVCNPATGACDTGTPLACNDGIECTDDTCDPVAGCVYTNNANTCDDGSACTSGDACAGGACVGTPVACDDGDACNGSESCDVALGCQPGVLLDCDDQESCTADSCDPGTGCVHAVLTGSCSDGSLCTSGDTCVSGVCTGTPVGCDDTNVCNGTESCDPALGCQAGTPLVCDDTNTCTDDTCSPVTGCVYTNDDTNTCDDGNLCTTSDACTAGACGGTATPCSDGDACNGLETCNSSTGLCEGAAPLVCDDNNACTDDSCAPATGCVNDPNTDPCDDGTACTSGDQCAAGDCVGTPIPCNDSNACNGVETCDAVLGCQIGATPVCNDDDVCTSDTCDPLLGCVNTPFPNVGVCRLIQVIDAINAQPVTVFGKEKTRKRLLRKVEGALRATQKFYTGNLRLQRNNQRRALRRLEGAVHQVQTGLIKGTFDPQFGDDLLELMSDASSDIQQAIP